MAHVTANDGTKLFYEEAGKGRPLVMIHGWTFTGRFFRDVVPALSMHARVITPDLRGHGRSDKPDHGYRVSRLAADLRDLLIALDLSDATLLGWSLGCPVIWSYLELFGQDRVRDVVLVEQTPRQYQTADWRKAHAQCFDQASCATMLMQMRADPASFDEQNLTSCMHLAPSDEDRRFMLAEMAMAPLEARAAAMADHTVHDWRDLLPHLDVPALVMVAEKDSVFPEGGAEWAGEHMPNARTVRFENSSHMIFHDQRAKFEQVVTDYLGSADD
ncbi:alpha/beta fold hydrolase [Sphingomonas lacusdianchii]|uniref:alpha/beta fold hydrolase n=1 Tax=Sphingomonas lacusdianchii TaxID=2917992 RepID=UPI001F5905FA|nr:alpha/beta hydrolase [Sphingomonas sp. JXJ CY 53]